VWHQWKSKNVIFGPHIQLGMSSSLNETNVMCYLSGVMVFEMVLGIKCKITMPLTSYSWVILSLFKKHLGLLQIIPCWICTLFPLPYFSHWIRTIKKERKPSKSWWDERWGVLPRGTYGLSFFVYLPFAFIYTLFVAPFWTIIKWHKNDFKTSHRYQPLNNNFDKSR